MIFNVIKHDEINFAPIKNKLNDRGYDIKAFCMYVNDVPVEFIHYQLRPKTSVIFGIGVSLDLKSIEYIPTLETIKNLLQGTLSINNIQDTCIKFTPSSEIKSRSGLGFKSSIECFNGQIDNTFNDMIRIKLTNNGNDTKVIKQGDRIGQLIIEILPEYKFDINKVDTIEELNGNSRGGFGSSGV